MSTQLQMRFKAPLIGATLMCLASAHGVAGAASEVEPNDTRSQAQSLIIYSSGGAVSGAIGSGGGLSTDLDLYSFEAKADDVPVITIVSDGNWDTILGLYDAAGNLLNQNDDAYPANPDSISPYDSRIDGYRIAVDGTYYVAVTPVPRYLDTGFAVMNATMSAYGGAYALAIQGVTPTAVGPAPEPTPAPAPAPGPVTVPEPTTAPPLPDSTVVTIEVRHWSREDNESENRRYGKLIPVAILSSADFDAMSVDQGSLTFGATGSESSFARCRKHGKDVNRDGKRDLVCYFKTEATGFQVGDVQGFLMGSTLAGEEIRGSTALKIFRVAKDKRESWHERHGLDPHGKIDRPRKRK